MFGYNAAFEKSGLASEFGSEVDASALGPSGPNVVRPFSSMVPPSASLDLRRSAYGEVYSISYSDMISFDSFLPNVPECLDLIRPGLKLLFAHVLDLLQAKDDLSPLVRLLS